MIEIIIRGTPTAWARAGKHGLISFTPAKQKEAARRIQHEANIAMGSRPLLQGSIELTLVFAYEWPKIVSRRRRAVPGACFKGTRPDLDNLIKLVCDALNGIVWSDDGQVATVSATKCYALFPSVSILVAELPTISPPLPQKESRSAARYPEKHEPCS